MAWLRPIVIVFLCSYARRFRASRSAALAGAAAQQASLEVERSLQEVMASMPNAAPSMGQAQSAAGGGGQVLRRHNVYTATRSDADADGTRVVLKRFVPGAGLAGGHRHRVSSGSPPTSTRGVLRWSVRF